jgi:glycosyltransferase involved in cell wall biosynthesis
MRVAYYSPMPPDRSGIADYSALLVPALRDRLDLVLARPHRRQPPADAALFQLGNDPESVGWIYEALRRRRGLVVLHEIALHGLVAGLTLGRGDQEAYLAAIERDGGPAGRLAGERALAGLEPPLWETRSEEFPLVHEALDLADGVIVHSRYAERKVRDVGYDRAVHRVPLPAPTQPLPASSRSALPSRGAPVVGSLGKVNPAKRIPQLLLAFARLRLTFPEALLVLAGGGSTSEYVRLRLEPLGLEVGQDVLLLDYVDHGDFLALVGRCDICVSLRSPTLGESSGSAIAALAAGTPLVVSDVGWFSELPEPVAAKVPPDEWEVDHLTAVLELLASNESLRSGMAEAAQAYARAELDLDRCADAYVAALESRSAET